MTTIPILAIILFIIFAILVYICFLSDEENYKLPESSPYYDPSENTSWNDVLQAWDWQPIKDSEPTKGCSCEKDYCSS